MRARTRTYLTVAGCLILAGAYLHLDRRARHQERMATVTSLSPGSTGLSVFRESASRESSLKQSPLLMAKELEGARGIMILSPLSPPTRSESAIIRAFVASGGVLVTGFHDESSWASIQPLLLLPPLAFSIRKDPEFRNHQVVLSAPRENEAGSGGLLRTGEKYAFYSEWLLDGPDCKERDQAACYVRVSPYHRGKVVVIAGLPFLSNAMIWRESNRLAALRLGVLAEPLVIDEYHHFFSDRGWGDLALEWRISLPVLALTLGLMLLFAFGEEPEPGRRDPGAADGQEPESYHGLHRKILAEMLRSPDNLPSAIASQTGFLLRSFPRDREEILEASERAGAGRSPKPLTTLHRQLLKRSRKG